MAWQEQHNALLKETVYRTRLDNGLDVFVMPRRGFRKRYAVFSTRYGSIDNRFRRPGERDAVEVPDGIAHFLEHQLFEQEDGHVFDAFAALGASVNAYTSHTMTSYLFSTTGELAPALDRLLDFVQEPHFTPSGVQKEIGIIEQEIRMYADQPRHRLSQNLLEGLYHAHPVRIDIAGTPGSIRRITPELLYACYDTFYHPSNMALFVVGDVHPDAVLEQVTADMAGRAYQGRAPVERLFPDEPPSVARPRTEATLPAARPLFAVGFKDAALAASPREQLRREALTSLVLGAALGRGSRLYEELYRADLVDDGFSSRYQAGPNFGHTILGGETRDPDELHERLMAGFERLGAEGLPEDDVRRVQRQEIGELVQLFDSLEFVANGFLFYHFMGGSLFDYLDVLQEITPDDANERLAEHFRPERAAVSVIRPQN
ncbi:MAG: insulinase family protein [Firmicutes bacterium]|nr:insulinase family protein [Bacillota bacterium]